MRQALTIAILFLSTSVFCQGEASFKIKGRIKGMMDGDTIYLLRRQEINPVLLDSFIQITKLEKFSFEIPVCNGPIFYRLQPANKEEKIYLFLGNESIEVDGDLKVLEKAQVNGSKSQDDYSAYIELKQAFEKEQIGLPTYSKNLDEQINKINEAYFAKYPDSYYLPVLLLEYISDWETIKSKYTQMSAEVQNTKIGKEVLKLINAPKNPAHGELGHDCSIAVGQPLK